MDNDRAALNAKETVVEQAGLIEAVIRREFCGKPLPIVVLAMRLATIHLEAEVVDWENESNWLFRERIRQCPHGDIYRSLDLSVPRFSAMIASSSICCWATIFSSFETLTFNCSNMLMASCSVTMTPVPPRKRLANPNMKNPRDRVELKSTGRRKRVFPDRGPAEGKAIKLRDIRKIFDGIGPDKAGGNLWPKGYSQTLESKRGRKSDGPEVLGATTWNTKHPIPKVSTYI